MSLEVEFVEETDERTTETPPEGHETPPDARKDDDAPKTIGEKLLTVQSRLSVPKGRTNEYGGYAYRSKSDILEAVKPLAHSVGCYVAVEDSLADAGGWHYVRATAKLVDASSGESLEASGFAREPESRKGMDASQITGTASSYAGKYALCNLLSIDDTEDADSMDNRPSPRRERMLARVAELEERSGAQAAVWREERFGGIRAEEMSDEQLVEYGRHLAGMEEER